MKTPRSLLAALISCFIFGFSVPGIAIDISGYIDSDRTLTLAESPVNITGDLYLRNGATLTIASGVVVNFMSSTYEIYIGSSTISTGTLIADNVTFNGYTGSTTDDEIYIRYGSAATLTNCIFNDTYLYISESALNISDCSFSDVITPIVLYGYSTPSISNLTFSNVTNPGIGISGTISTSETLGNLGIPYYLTGDLYVNSGATLTIASGVVLNTISGSYELFVGSSTTSIGTLVANNVTFNGYLGSTTDEKIYIQYGSGASLTSCSFNDIYLHVAASALSISNSNIADVITPIILYGYSAPSISNLTFSNVTNPGIGISGTISTSETLGNLGYPYYLTGDLYVNSGATLTIASGVILNTISSSYELFIGSNTSSIGTLIANGVTFNGYLGSTTDEEIYIQYGSGASLTNCSFNDVYLYLSESSPGVSTSSFADVLTPIVLVGNSSPTVSNLTFTNVTYPGFGLSGTVSTGRTLTNTGLPYYIMGDLTVNNGATLTFQTGLEVCFISNSYEMRFGSSTSSLGWIIAEGVHFYSLDTYDDEIYFYYGSGGTIQGCNLETIEIHVNSASEPYLLSNRFYNSQNAIYLYAGANPHINNNDFYQNTSAIINNSGVVLSAENNFWGHYTGPEMLALPGGMGEVITGDMDVEPFLLTPNNGTINGTMDRTSFTFGSMAVGIAETQQLRVINTGDIGLEFSGFQTDNPSFSVGQSFPVWIGDGDTLMLDVIFSPHAEGPQNGNLSLETNDYNNQLMTVSCTGMGEPVISSSVDGLDFGLVDLNETETRSFYLKNISTSTITVDSVTSDHPYFKVTTSSVLKAAELLYWDESDPSFNEDAKKGTSAVTAARIYSGDSIEISVDYRPFNRDVHEGLLQVYYNSSGIEVLTLEGEGVADPVNVNIQSIESNNFPFLYMNVLVDTFGTGIESLTKSNFAVRENGVLQTDGFVVTPPGQGGGSRLADVVFIMDNSGSMDAEQAQVENNVVEFVTALNLSGVDFALGLCRYGQSASGGAPLIQDNGTLTSDPEYFKTTVWNRNTTDGSIEPGYQSIQTSVNSFAFRPGAKKILIIITDESPSQGVVNQQAAIDACMDNSVTLFALTTQSLFSLFTPITFPTNGETFDITSPFDEILDYITNLVSSTYLVQYQSNQPLQEAIRHLVEVEVNYTGNVDTDTISYFPWNVPRIGRTESTLFLHSQSWGEGTVFNIEVEVQDLVAPYTQTVNLYYRTAGTTQYQAVTMSLKSENVYEAPIPGNISLNPGIEYYIEASDGEGTSTDPSLDALQKPYQIAILPNEAPSVIHDTVRICDPNLPVVIEATITDNTNWLASSHLHYRVKGQLVYQETPLVLVAGDLFRATIPASFVESNSIEYYILAKDDFGIGNYIGWPDNPLFIQQKSTLIHVNLTDSPTGINRMNQDAMVGGIIYKYYILKDENGITIPGLFEVELEASVNGRQIPSKCTVLGDDLVSLSLRSDDLNLNPGDQTDVTIGEYLVVNRKGARADNLPESITVNMLKQPSSTSFDFFAAASLGAGFIAGGAGVGATAAAVKISVKGTGGVGMNISFDQDMTETYSRRFEASLSAGVTVPSVTLPVGDVKVGLHAGIFTKILAGQSIQMHSSDNEDFAKLARTGFILETATLGSYNFSPITGVLLKGIIKSVNAFTDVEAAMNQHLYELNKGWGAGVDAGIKFSIDLPSSSGSTGSSKDSPSLTLADFSVGGNFLSKKSEYPNDPGLVAKGYKTAVYFNMDAFAFDTKFFSPAVFKFRNINMIDYKSVFKYNQLEEMKVTLEGTDEYSIFPVNIESTNFIKTFTFPKKALMDVVNYGDLSEASSLIWSESSYNPLKAWPLSVLNSFDYVLETIDQYYVPGDQPVTLESHTYSAIGISLPFQINLSAALGIGFELSAGLELAYMRSREYLTGRSVILGGEEYILEENTSIPPQEIQLNELMKGIVNDGVDVAKETIVGFFGFHQEVVSAAAGFAFSVADATLEAIRVRGNAVIAGAIMITTWPTWTWMAYDEPFTKASLKNTYVSKGAMVLNSTALDENSALTLVSYAHEIVQTNSAGVVLENLPQAIELSIPVVDTILTRLGFGPEYANQVRLFHYLDETITWEEIASSIANDTVTGYIYKSGTYALGIVTSPAADNIPPEITQMSPDADNGVSPYVVLEAIITDEAHGSGLDFNSLSMEFEGEPMEVLWAPDENKMIYAVSDSLSDGTYTFKVIASDLNGNIAEEIRSFTVGAGTGTEDWFAEGINSSTNLVIYPNPVTGDEFGLRLTLPVELNKAEIFIYDARGKIVDQLYAGFIEQGTSERSLRLSGSLTPGVYFLQVQDATRGLNVVKRMMVE